MPTKNIFNFIAIFSFMILVGYSLSRAFYTGSFMGIILSIVSLGAGIYFLCILAKAREEFEAKNNPQ